MFGHSLLSTFWKSRPNGWEKGSTAAAAWCGRCLRHRPRDGQEERTAEAEFPQESVFPYHGVRQRHKKSGLTLPFYVAKIVSNCYAHNQSKLKLDRWGTDQHWPGKTAPKAAWKLAMLWHFNWDKSGRIRQPLVHSGFASTSIEAFLHASSGGRHRRRRRRPDRRRRRSTFRSGNFYKSSRRQLQIGKGRSRISRCCFKREKSGQKRCRREEKR